MSARTTVMVLARAVIRSSEQSHWSFSSTKHGLFQQAGSLSCVSASCSSNADKSCFMTKVSRRLLVTATPLLAKAHHFLLGQLLANFSVNSCALGFLCSLRSCFGVFLGFGVWSLEFPHYNPLCQLMSTSAKSADSSLKRSNPCLPSH